jgi:hypothetical protein
MQFNLVKKRKVHGYIKCEVKGQLFFSSTTKFMNKFFIKFKYILNPIIKI